MFYSGLQNLFIWNLKESFLSTDLPPIANVIIVLANKIIEVINDANVKGVNCVNDNINDKKNQEIALEIVK